MIRNLDLIRNILLEAERKETATGWITPKIDGYSDEEIAYHIQLLMQAELLEGIELGTKTSYEYGVKNLTWKGHEFIDATRDDSLWNKAKKFLGKKITTVSFELIKDILIKYSKQELGLE